MIEDLLKSAQAEAEQILAQAQAKAAEQKKQAEAELKELVQKELDRYEQDLEELRKRNLALARLAARDRLVKAKSKLLADFYDSLTSEINKLPREEYLNFLLRMLSTRSQFGGEVVLNEEDKNRFGEELVRRANREAGKPVFSLAEQTHSLGRGLILQQAQIRENLTLNELMKQFRQQTEVFVAKELFSD